MTTPRTWTSREVRETFLSYFESRGHRRVSSSSLVPAEDPSLLFTNAGMNQFKDVFLGREARDYTRATTSQKCVRAGGKHNDLDNVGYTARHHTFFEMLGNFSFGDYFKEGAIDFAWELVTSPSYFGLDPARLWATVYRDDDEAAELWSRYLPKERIARFGEKDNFWSMGDTGPCGPCSELHYDQGPKVPGDATPNREGDRVIEIWNLVFMQFERDSEGRMNRLPKPSVDTGAGLERITAILQGKNNNYDTDFFAGVLARLAELSGKPYRGDMAVEDAPFRVIADHVRAATLLIWDGVLPSNEGRGYVLRRILRRALRYGRRLELGLTKPFLFELPRLLVRDFADIYFPAKEAERSARLGEIEAVLTSEEERFSRTVSEGADRVGEAVSELRRRGESVLTGETAFHFYGTFGIPFELIDELAADEGVRVDREGFEARMEEERERGRRKSQFDAADVALPDALVDSSWTTTFRGYPEDNFVTLRGTRVLGLFAAAKTGELVRASRISAAEEGLLVTAETVFYPEGGGQVADTGTLAFEGGQASVLDTRKSSNGRFVEHRIRVEEGSLVEGATVDMQIPEWTRRMTQANHTGTHLLHAALRRVLGTTTRQMGSLVAPDRLRFDYSAPRPTTPGELAEIERLVNEEILRDLPVAKEVMAMDAAKERGAIMFFGEKYGERVRVVDVPGFSTELCGGCHVSRTGEIGGLKIVSDKGLAAGVRRVEAVTSLNLLARFSRDQEILAGLEEVAQVPPEELVKKLKELTHRIKENEKEIARLKVAAALAGSAAPSTRDDGSANGEVAIGPAKVLRRRVASLPANELRNLADTFRGKLKSGVVLLGTEEDGKVTLLAAVTHDLVSKISASDLVRAMAPVVGGKGGGKPDMATAGGRDGSRIDEALALGFSMTKERLEA